MSARTGERPALLALQLDRPRRQHGGALARRVRARRRVGAGCAQLQTHPLDLGRAPMPQQLDRAREIETDLHDELERVRVRIDADGPEAVPAELDAETEAAKRAPEPLGPATRQAPERPAEVDDVDTVKRLIDLTRRRPPRQR